MWCPQVPMYFTFIILFEAVCAQRGYQKSISFMVRYSDEFVPSRIVHNSNYDVDCVYCIAVGTMDTIATNGVYSLKFDLL